MRAFIALDIPEAVRNELLRLTDILKKEAADVKWVRAENLHLTLRFIGDVPEEKITFISDILKAVCAAQQPF